MVEPVIGKLKQLLIENHHTSKENGYIGYDPQLFWHLPGYKAYAKKKTTLRRIIRRIEYEFLKMTPNLILPYAKFFKVEKELSPYGLGLFLQTYTKMYSIFHEEKYILEAEKIVELLTPLLIELPHGLGAGNPKNKHNEHKPFFKTFVTNETSYLVVVAEIIFGLVSLYKVSKKQSYKLLIEKLCVSITKDYAIKKCGCKSSMLDYSSSPDNSHILNANALAMASLITVESSTTNTDIASNIYNYIFEYLEWDKIPYAGMEDKLINPSYSSADLFHTGFTLRGMLILAKHLNKTDDIKIIINRITKVLNDYLSNGNIVLFQEKHEIEIHSLSEYINLYAILYPTLDQKNRNKYLSKILNNIDAMNNGKGSYYYKKQKSKTIDIYFPRWTQAAMMNAISNLITTLNSN